MTFTQGIAVGIAGTCVTALALVGFLRWLFSDVLA